MVERWFCCLFLIYAFSVNIAHCQDKAVLESESGNGPKTNRSLDLRVANDLTAHLEFQLNRIKPLVITYESQYEEKLKRIEELEHILGKLKKQAPSRLSSLNKEDRSDLASYAMRRYLDVKIELAALAKTIAALEAKAKKNEKSKVQKLESAELDFEVTSASERYQLAKLQRERNEKLWKRGTVNEIEFAKSKLTTKIAENELKAAQTRVSLEKARLQAANAELLADKRLELVPLKAKIEEIEAFFEALGDAGRFYSEVDSVNQMISDTRSEKNKIGDVLFELNREMVEIDSRLKQLESQKKRR